MNTVALYVGLIYALWVYYLAVMNVKRAIDAGTCPVVTKWVAYLTLLPPALLLDWALNMLLTAPFADWPAGWRELVTGRLKRYAYEAQHLGTWRQRAAVHFAKFLDAFDPSGRHI